MFRISDRDMEYYQIRTFIAVAEENHLTRAAKRLNTSQPAVSAHIKALEEELSVTLFKRTPKGMVLTTEGYALKGPAEKILAAFNELKNDAQQFQNELSGDVNIGLNSDPDFLKTGELFTIMNNDYPGLNLNLSHSISGQILLDIKSEKLDGGYYFGKNNHDELESFVLKELNLVIIGPYQWKNRIDVADWKEIAELPWIGNPVFCPFNQLFNDLFIKRNLTPAISHIAEQESTIKSLVAANAGMSFMLEDDAVKAAKKNQLTIWHKKTIKWFLYFAFLRKRQKDPVVKAMINTIKDTWCLHDKVSEAQ